MRYYLLPIRMEKLTLKANTRVDENVEMNELPALMEGQLHPL